MKIAYNFVANIKCFKKAILDSMMLRDKSMSITEEKTLARVNVITYFEKLLLDFIPKGSVKLPYLTSEQSCNKVFIIV